ncbi:MAG: Carbohydrate binding domain protein [Tenericutes bacterium ADurb.Bin087]|nr:MAG: Carbohydrate binding domain protein [Tenericutes bacterium ADurb.Bin087]
MKKRRYILLALLSLVVLGSCKGNTSESEKVSEGSVSHTSTGDSVPVERTITWYGADDIVITIGDEFTLLDGVRAVDTVDGDLEVVVADDDYFDSYYVSQYTIKYEATNSAGTKSTKYRMVQVVKGCNVFNGNFAMGKTYWRFDTPGGQGTFNVVNEEAVFSFTDTGSEAWSLQLYQQPGITFNAGRTYEMTFIAKSEKGRSISAGFENYNGFAMLIPGYPAMVLTSEFQTYSAIYTADADYASVKPVLYLGRGLDIDGTASKANPLDLVVDDIKVREIILPAEEKRPVFSNAGPVTVYTGDQFEALPPVTAADYKGNDISDRIERIGAIPDSIAAVTRMLVSYRVTDEEGNFNYVNRSVSYQLARDNPYNLINGEFNNGLQGWVRDVNQTNGTGAADFIDNEDGTVTVDITNGSNDNWHIQFYQSNVSIQAGKIYRVTLIAKASVERKVTIEISNPAQSYSRVATKLISLTTEYQTFLLEFKSTVTCLAKFSLLLGAQGANQVILDKFDNDMITADEATTIDLRDYEPYEVINGDFKYGYYGWTQEMTHGAEVNFIADQANEQIKIDVITPGTANWHVQVNQDGKTFTEGVTYVMTVKASALASTVITMEVTNNNGETVLARNDITLTTTLTDYTMEFTPSQTFTLGKCALLLGMSDVTTITVKNVMIGIKG